MSGLLIKYILPNNGKNEGIKDLIRISDALVSFGITATFDALILKLQSIFIIFDHLDTIDLSKEELLWLFKTSHI
jgi:hypothetical protein